MKPDRDMTPSEDWRAQRPIAHEPEPVAMFEPGAVIFVNGRYRAVMTDISAVWPLAEICLSRLLDFLPLRHRLEYWRKRIECGEVLLTLFLDTSRPGTVDGGIIECGPADDGTPVTMATTWTLHPLDLTGLSEFCESIAVLTGTESVVLWTPKPVPAAPGYLAMKLDDGFYQGIRVRPMQ